MSRALLQRVLPFGLAFLTGVLFFYVVSLNLNNIRRGWVDVSSSVDTGANGRGRSGPDRGSVSPDEECFECLACLKGRQCSQIGPQTDGGPGPLKILSKPRAEYSDMARQHNVQGAVKLRVTFLSSGEIGDITAVSELPDGLTERAIAAAKRIKFEPAQRAGRPVTVTKVVEYSFSIY